MNDSPFALFFLGNHNEVDHIVPILYKLGERNNIDVDVVLKRDVSIHDYRVDILSQYKNITILDNQPTSSQFSLADQTVDLVKEIGRKMPGNILESIYQKFVHSSTQVRIPEEFSDKEYGVIAFDWSHAKADRTGHFASNNDLITIVLPHGDSPFINRLETENSFDEFVNSKCNFKERKNPDELGYQYYKEFIKHDYQLFPNRLTASRMPEETTDSHVRVFGSPRYNSDWLNILSQIRPDNTTLTDSKLNIVFFVRHDSYFVSKKEVRKTIKLLSQFDEISTVVKEHPKASLLSPNATNGIDNVEIVKDEIPSASIIQWGDVFLSLGTTIVFEPIIRKKPVLELEYAHANHTVVSSYFSESDMRCKEDLYHSIHDLLANGTQNFYTDQNHRKFLDEMISPNEKPVLDSWAEFIESQCK